MKHQTCKDCDDPTVRRNIYPKLPAIISSNETPAISMLEGVYQHKPGTDANCPANSRHKVQSIKGKRAHRPGSSMIPEE